MANHVSAKKASRQSEKRRAINGMRVSAMRTAIKKVISAVTSRDKESALSLFRSAESVIMRNARRNIIPFNTARRKISGLSKLVKNCGVA